MNCLERSDARFVAQAGNDSERRAAIERLSGLRRIAFRWAIVLSVCFLIIFTLGAVHPTFGAVGAAIGTALFMLAQWMNVMKIESDLRLLLVVEQLRRGGL
jgi:hypothetical protein